jgi:hypothetical protein
MFSTCCSISKVSTILRDYSFFILQGHYRINPFIFIKNKRSVVSSEGFLALEKRCDVFSEGDAVHPVRCDSPLQIVMAVWCTYLRFELSGSGVTAYRRL